MHILQISLCSVQWRTTIFGTLKDVIQHGIACTCHEGRSRCFRCPLRVAGLVDIRCARGERRLSCKCVANAIALWSVPAVYQVGPAHPCPGGPGHQCQLLPHLRAPLATSTCGSRNTIHPLPKQKCRQLKVCTCSPTCQDHKSSQLMFYAHFTNMFKNS